MNNGLFISFGAGRGWAVASKKEVWDTGNHGATDRVKMRNKRNWSELALHRCHWSFRRQTVAAVAWLVDASWSEVWERETRHGSYVGRVKGRGHCHSYNSYIMLWDGLPFNMPQQCRAATVAAGLDGKTENSLNWRVTLVCTVFMTLLLDFILFYLHVAKCFFNHLFSSFFWHFV